jgi:hypothetical protein
VTRADPKPSAGVKLKARPVCVVCKSRQRSREANFCCKRCGYFQRHVEAEMAFTDTEVEEAVTP